LPRRFVLAVVATQVQLDAEVLEPGAEVQRWLVVLATEFSAIREGCEGCVRWLAAKVADGREDSARR